MSKARNWKVFSEAGLIGTVSIEEPDDKSGKALAANRRRAGCLAKQIYGPGYERVWVDR